MDGLRLATAPQGHRPLQTGPSCVIDSSLGWPASPANAAPIGHLSGPCTTRVAPRLARCPPSANADTIIVMDGGRILEQGSHADLLRSHGVYYNLHNSQFTEAPAAAG